MKLTTSEKEEIANNIKASMLRRGVSAARLSRSCGIEPSRVSKILAGNFATLNPTVVQICTFLAMPMQGGLFSQQTIRIVTSALRVWDGTPEDVEAVVNLFDQLADMRGRSTGKTHDGARVVRKSR